MNTARCKDILNIAFGQAVNQKKYQDDTKSIHQIVIHIIHCILETNKMFFKASMSSLRAWGRRHATSNAERASETSGSTIRRYFARSIGFTTDADGGNILFHCKIVAQQRRKFGGKLGQIEKEP